MSKVTIAIFIFLGALSLAHFSQADDSFVTTSNTIQPSPPNYDPDYGPGYTSYWQDGGTFKAPKFLMQDITINAGNMYVNELDLRVSNADLDVGGAYVYLSSGRVVELRQVNGSIPQYREFRIRLDYYNSLRVDRIVLRVSSPQLIGPSSKVQILLGIAR